MIPVSRAGPPDSDSDRRKNLIEELSRKYGRPLAEFLYMVADKRVGPANAGTDLSWYFRDQLIINAIRNFLEKSGFPNLFPRYNTQDGQEGGEILDIIIPQRGLEKLAAGDVLRSKNTLGDKDMRSSLVFVVPLVGDRTGKHRKKRYAMEVQSYDESNGNIEARHIYVGLLSEEAQDLLVHPYQELPNLPLILLEKAEGCKMDTSARFVRVIPSHP